MIPLQAAAGCGVAVYGVGEVVSRAVVVDVVTRGLSVIHYSLGVILLFINNLVKHFISTSTYANAVHLYARDVGWRSCSVIGCTKSHRIQERTRRLNS